MPNTELEQILDTLLPKEQATTITVDLEEFRKLLDLHVAALKEVNTAREKTRVEQAVQEAVAKEPAPVKAAPIKNGKSKV